MTGVVQVVTLQTIKAVVVQVDILVEVAMDMNHSMAQEQAVVMAAVITQAHTAQEVEVA